MPWGVVAAVGGAVVSSAMADDNGAEGANNASADATRMQAQITRDQYDRYLRLYAPLEDSFVEESQGLGSIANQEVAATRAKADVTGSYAGVREKLSRAPGANPNSQAYLQELNKIGLAEAAASAAGQTGARERIQDKGLQARVNALNLGKGLPGTAASSFGSIASAYNTQAQNGFSQANQAGAGVSKMLGGVFESKTFKGWLDGGTSSPQMPGTPYVTQAPIAAPADYGQFI